MKQYDIFISYRRSSYDTANLIATRLKSAGYSVFFDMETLRSGKFNEQLYDAIDNCKDFIVVLPPNALDRCVNEDDWVRLEVCHAMEKGKNVIPVMLNGFTWPEPMPEGMENLRDCQALTASSIEYFDLAMERLQKQYLQSKPRIPFFRLLKYASACILSLLTVIAILWGVFYILSKDVCVQYATALTKDANNVHIIAEEQYKLAKAWETFDRAFSYERDPERIAEIQDFIEERIDLAENNVKQCWTADSVEMDISTYQRFLLSLHNINAEEIAMSPVLATLYYTDFTGEQLNFLRETARNPNSLNMKQADAILKVSEHTINSYYAGILSELSTFPKSSLGAFNELSPNWIHFPIQLYKVGESQEYYENIIIVEGKLADEILRRLESLFEQMDATVEDLENKDAMLDELIEQGQMYIDSTEMKNLIAAEIEQIKKENEEELAQRRMKVEQQRESIEASKAKIDEMEREFVAMYEDLKNNCTIEENDDQWYKWGKICRMGAFLNLLVDSEKQLKSEGLYNTSVITPDVAYADISSMLSVYQTYHPESKNYVASAKQFFREVSKGKRQYAGIVIFAFKDDAQHPFLKQGDIIIQYDGQPIKYYNDLNNAYKNNPSGEITYLRLTNGSFEKHQKPLVQSDIVGYLNLAE